MGKALTDLPAEQVAKKQRVNVAKPKAPPRAPLGLDDSEASAVEEEVEGAGDDGPFRQPPDVVVPAPAALSAATATCSAPQTVAFGATSTQQLTATQRMDRLRRRIQVKQAARDDTAMEATT